MQTILLQRHHLGIPGQSLNFTNIDTHQPMERVQALTAAISIITDSLVNRQLMYKGR